MKGKQGVTPTLDAFFAGLRHDKADWVEVKLAEEYQVVEIGQSLVLHLTLTLPRDVKELRRYGGSFRLFDQEITYTVIPAPVKKPRAKRAPKARSSTKTRKKRN